MERACDAVIQNICVTCSNCYFFNQVLIMNSHLFKLREVQYGENIVILLEMS